MRSFTLARPIWAIVVALATLSAAAAPAVAHEEISPTTFPTGKPAFLTLTAADEKRVDLTTIALTAPAGVPFGTTTHQPAGWTVQRGDHAITWSGGRVAPDNFEQWGFEIEGADQPGVLGYQVTLGFADGTSDDAAVEVTAVAPGTPADGGTSPATGVAPTAGGPVSVKTADKAEGRADFALTVAILAGALALVGVGLALRRRQGSTPDSTDAGAEEGQDW